MDFFSQPFFEKWVNHPAPQVRQWLELENRFLLEKIEPGCRILDIGCGFGRHMKLLAPTATQVIGLDNTPNMVEKARENLSEVANAKVFLSEAIKTDFEDGKFDCVICMTNTFGNFGVLKRKALEEMARVVRNGGKIVISVYSKNALEVRKKDYEKIGLHITKMDGRGTIFTREGLVSEQFSKQQLTELACECGLNCEIRELTPISYLCEFTKR